MKCPNCGAQAGKEGDDGNGWEARETYLFANQHGYGKRLFCHMCGQWTDFKCLKQNTEPIVTVRKNATKTHIEF